MKEQMIKQATTAENNDLKTLLVKKNKELAELQVLYDRRTEELYETRRKVSEALANGRFPIKTLVG